MGTLERTETLTHRIGVDGRVSVKSIGGTLRVHGVSGDQATLTVTYRIRAGDQAAAERVLDGGRVLVDRGPGLLEVETPERRLSTGLAWLFGGARVNADISVDIPWGARVRLETMSGSIEAVGLVGEQKYRTVSGDVRLWSLAGNIEAGAISGSISLDRGGDVRLRANSVSGSVRVRAARFHGMVISTTSGGITVGGALDPAGDYRAESISGSVELAPRSGVTAELRSISGSITSRVAGHVVGGRGFWRTVIGDGRALFRVSSTSGSLRISEPGPADPVMGGPTTEAATASPAAPEAFVPPVAPTAGADVPVPASETSPSGSAPAEPAPAAHSGVETWNADEDADPAAEAAEDDELAVLRALERGEIGVDEAAERLECRRR